MRTRSRDSHNAESSDVALASEEAVIKDEIAKEDVKNEKEDAVFVTGEAISKAHYCGKCDRYVRSQALYEQHIKQCR